MPQPALHLLLGRQTLASWAQSGSAPFDVNDDRLANAFLHGTLAPDMGNFPGGMRAFAHAVHTQRTADVTRALFDAAQTPPESAFAWGWLSHVLADAAIHPLVNREAARHSANGAVTIVEHVRVEVGLDVWFCCGDDVLDGLRLRPAFDRNGYMFLARTLDPLLDVEVTAAQLAKMERGLILFSHAALDFARGGARRLSWGVEGPQPSVMASAVWHTATRFSRRESVVHAYLNPRVPEPALVQRVAHAIAQVHDSFHAYWRTGLDRLPSWNLEDGSLLPEARHVA
jgi:hypothetical protein